MSKCVFSTLGSSFLGASAATACAYYYPPAGAPPPPPPIMPINGPRELMSSYCLNQLGLAGGQVPALSYLMLGQSILSFKGLIPEVFATRFFMLKAKYLSSKMFRSSILSVSMSTFFFYNSLNSLSR
jgi:hypothetical protein